MHPARGRFVTGGARLRHLVLVVRETKVESAAVDVEHILQVTVAHRGAFDMPARASRAEGGVPARVERVGALRCLPQREIARVVLVGGHVGGVDRIVFVVAGAVDGRAHRIGDFGGGVHFGGLFLMRQLAVVRPGGHVEVHIAGRLAVLVVHHVAVPVVDDLLDEVDHVDHVAGRARLVCRRFDAERVVRLGELALVDVGALPPLLARGRRLVEDFVVDVGDVAHERDLVSQTLEPTAHHIEGDGRADVADVRRALHGGATHVDTDLAGFDRREIRHRVRGGVVQLQPCGGLGHRGGSGSVGILRFLRVCHTHENIARIGHRRCAGQ